MHSEPRGGGEVMVEVTKEVSLLAFSVCFCTNKRGQREEMQTMCVKISHLRNKEKVGGKVITK